MRHWKTIAILTLIVIAIGIPVIWPEDTLFFFRVITSSLLSNSKPPPIAEGQITEKDWLKWDKGSHKFTVALQRQFPAGTDESKIRSTLLKQGFHSPEPPSPDCIRSGQHPSIGEVYEVCPTKDWKKILTYEWGSLPCTQRLTVWWSADNRGKIIDITGNYGGACM